jgi:outer membrane protein assembly factor BamB
MTVIELGEVSSGSSPEEPSAPPRRSDVRRIAVLVVAVLTVLLVTGSERPEPRGLPLLWSVPLAGDQFVLTADSLYMQASAGRPELIAYDAADGTVRWRRPAGQPEYWINTDVPGVLLVPDFTDQQVTDENGDTSTQPVVTETAALDPRTGRELWRSSGEASLRSGDLIQMSVWDDRSAGATRFLVVNRADGRVVWQIEPRPAVTNWTATGADPQRPDRFITATKDGLVEVRRMDTGAVVIRKQLPWLLPDSPVGAFAQLFGARSVLFVIREDAGRQVIDAYRPETLDRLWSRAINMSHNFFECGGRICISTGQGTVEAVDAATGKPAWTSAGWDYAREITPDRLLTEHHQGEFSGLIDATDGRKILQFPDGLNLVDQTTGTVISLGANLTEPPGSPVSQPAADGTVVLRGLVGPVGNAGCQYTAGRLACAVTGGTLQVRDVG